MNTDRLAWRRAGLLLFITMMVMLPGCKENRGDPAVYNKHCASCHGREGQGLRALYPPLTDSAYLDGQINELPCLISSGVRGKIDTGKRTKNIRMPAFENLTIQEMSSLIGYLQLNWGRGSEPVSEQTVSQWLRTCP